MLFVISLLAYFLRVALCGIFVITNQDGSDRQVFSKEVFQCNLNKSCKVVAKRKDGTGFKFFESENGFGNGNDFDIVWKKIPGGFLVVSLSLSLSLFVTLLHP